MIISHNIIYNNSFLFLTHRKPHSKLSFCTHPIALCAPHAMCCSMQSVVAAPRRSWLHPVLWWAADQKLRQRWTWWRHAVCPQESNLLAAAVCPSDVFAHCCPAHQLHCCCSLYCSWARRLPHLHPHRHLRLHCVWVLSNCQLHCHSACWAGYPGCR